MSVMPVNCVSNPLKGTNLTGSCPGTYLGKRKFEGTAKIATLRLFEPSGLLLKHN